ncbi:glycosyltransferase family 4 protein [Candidatus Uhrbacteria bacterium]|nr:glycosyltransferase family 4 protein [Candidatus Uhrbacteria bacterium]
MNILLLTSFYPPEIRSISTMMRELAEGLVARGHTVTVMTPQPEDNLPDDEKGKSWPTVVKEGAVTVVRIKTFGQRTSNYVLRGLSELTLPFVYRRAIKKFVAGTIDGVVVYIPHFPLAQVGAWVKKKYGARYLLNVQDIFPQNAIDAGIMKHQALIKFYEYLERRAYRAADALTTHTSGGREFLIQKKAVPPEKITTVYNWIDVAGFACPSPPPSPTGGEGEHESFRRQYGLEGKFIFLFAGIFGPTQGLELVIEVARRMADIKEAHFLLVGEGTEKERLKQLANKYGLGNVTFGAFVPPRQYPALLAEADVGLMCLAPENTTAVVPGKLLGYMAAGLPVAAFLQAVSEGHRIIREARCGYSIVSDDPERAEKMIRQMYTERLKLKEYGKSGQTYAAKHFSRSSCLDILAKLITNRPH